MKINSLYIASFGKIKDLKLDFTDGFNVIYGQNEKGKTTVMAFIKMMFYGSERGSSSVAKNIRKKYTPWDSAIMGGSIDFEFEGKKYRLEKEFKTSNTTDKTVLTELSLGTRQSVPSDVGTKFFGLSLQAFERSVFIGQFGYPESDSVALGELNSKLSNLTLSGDESVSFEAVNSRLQKAKLALMSKSGRAGEYDKNLKLSQELQSKIEKLRLKAEESSAKKEQLKAIQQEILLLNEKKEKLNEKISKEQDVRNAKKLKELLSLKEKLDNIDKDFTLQDGKILDEMYLRKLKFCISKTLAAKDNLLSKQNEAEVLKKSMATGVNDNEEVTEETVQNLSKEIETNEKEYNLTKEQLQKNTVYTESIKEKQIILENSKKPFNTLFLILSVIFLGLSAVLFITEFTVFGVVALAVGLIFAILTFVLRPKRKSEAESLEAKILELQNEAQKLESKLKTQASDIEILKHKLTAYNTALNTTATVLEKQKEMLKAAEDECKTLKENFEKEFSVLKEQFAYYKTCETLEEIINDFEALSVIENDRRQLKNQIDFYLKELGGISLSQAEEKLKEVKNSDIALSADFDILKAEYDKAVSLIAEKSGEAGVVSAEIKNLSSNTENEAELTKRLSKLCEVINRQKEFCDIAEIASVTLLESFGEIRQSYSAHLEKKAAEIFENLTDSKYAKMTVSNNFDITVGEKGVFSNREIDYLSSGTIDQAYLSLRLALSSLISQGKEVLPILLDDALTQYDDERANKAIEYFKEYSSNAQIIMFTCHKAIADIAAQNNGNIIELN